jgi:hypothetical protein
MGVGGVAAAGGVIVTPFTEGASLAVSFAGTGAVAHGTMVAGNSIRHLATGNNYGGKKDTESKTSKEALRNAKDQNGVPRSQQPDKTTPCSRALAAPLLARACSACAVKLYPLASALAARASYYYICHK